MEELELAFCYQLTDISAISLLSGLRSLELVYCEEVINYSPIGQLKNLGSLWINGANDVDFAFAAELPLTSMVIANVGSVDLAPFSGKTSLGITVLSGTEISGVGPDFRPEIIRP